MRRESSTVVVAVGQAGEESLAGLAESPNVSVARAQGGPGVPRPAGTAGRSPQAGTGGQPRRAGAAGGSGESSPRVDAAPAWETGALAMREAARRGGAYVIVLDDPLADVAAAWSAMWDVSAGPAGAAWFEQRAAEALAAWRDKRFELPDYYLVLTPAQPAEHAPDLYLGPLRAVRPRRVAVTAVTDSPAAQAARLRDTLRSLQHGPWWPPLDELVDAARSFYPGSLAEARA